MRRIKKILLPRLKFISIAVMFISDILETATIFGGGISRCTVWIKVETVEKVLTASFCYFRTQ